MAAVSLLSASGLCKSFGGVAAVAGVDLELPDGEVRALIGPNGAGKTTLVGLLCGRINADAGRVRFAGEDITARAMHKRARLGIAYTFQITSIFANLTVRENVAIAAQNCRVEGDVGGGRAAKKELRLLRARTAEDALQRVGLAGMQTRRAGALSYGHQRLLETAMGLALNPRLLIFDEPTQGLADGEIDRFCEVVQDAARTVTVLLIEHNMSVVMRLARRITVLESGRVLADGTPVEIQNNAEVQAAYLGGF